MKMKNLQTFDIFESKKPFDGSRIVFHGTKKKFDKFEVGQPAANPLTYGKEHEISDDTNLGIFFTDNLMMAKYFAGIMEFDGNVEKYVKIGDGHVVSVRVNLKNPFVMDKNSPGVDIDNDWDASQMMFELIKKAGGAEKYKKKLIKEGYDGIVLKDNNTNYYQSGVYSIIIAFDPNQVEIVKWD